MDKTTELSGAFVHLGVGLVVAALAEPAGVLFVVVVDTAERAAVVLRQHGGAVGLGADPPGRGGRRRRIGSTGTGTSSTHGGRSSWPHGGAGRIYPERPMSHLADWRRISAPSA